LYHRRSRPALSARRVTAGTANPKAFVTAMRNFDRNTKIAVAFIVWSMFVSVSFVVSNVDHFVLKLAEYGILP